MSNLPWGYSLSRVKSNQTVNYDSFNGDIEFNIQNDEAEEWISTKNSFMTVKLRIVQTDEGGNSGLLQPIINTGTRAAPTAVSIPFLNANPVANLFTAVSCDVKGNNVSLNQNIAPVNTLYRTLYESKSEQDTINSTNAVKPMKLLDSDTTRNKGTVLTDYFVGYPNNLANMTNRQLYALQNMYMFNKFNEVELNSQLMTPLFYSEELIPPKVPINLRFSCNPYYYLDLVNIAGSNVCSLPAGNATNFSLSRLSSANSNNGVLNNIGIGIVDISLWLYKIRLPSPTVGAKLLGLKQFSSLLHAVPNGTHDEFNVEFKRMRRITHIALAFVQKKASMKCTQTDFSSGYYIGTAGAGGVDTPNAGATNDAMVYSNSPITQLLNMRVEYGSNVYPITPYTLNFDSTANMNTPYISNDLYRCYYDMITMSDGLRDRSGHLLSMDAFTIQPIICFKTHQAPNTDSNTCLVSLDFKNSITNANVLVVGMYDESLILDFDQYATLVDAKLQ